jgi:hypothetical protein
LLAPDNDVFAMARFSKPEMREKLEAIGVGLLAAAWLAGGRPGG